MTTSELLSEGFSLMLFGMGFVFLFLILLVLATSLMSNIIDRYFQGAVPSSVSSAPCIPENSVTGSALEQGELVAVISAAIHMHRTKKTQQEKRL